LQAADEAILGVQQQEVRLRMVEILPLFAKRNETLARMMARSVGLEEAGGPCIAVDQRKHPGQRTPTEPNLRGSPPSYYSGYVGVSPAIYQEPMHTRLAKKRPGGLAKPFSSC
jgi:hypothetical protein